MRLNKIILFATVVFFVFRASFFVSADINDDKILDLSKKIAELTAQAETYRKTALQKHQQADTLKRQLDILANQILKLQKEIEATEKKISVTKLEINDREGKIYDAGKKIEKEQSAIKEAITYIYRRDRTNLLAVLTQNDSISEFMGQAEDLARVSARLNQLLIDLKEHKAELEKQREDLLGKKQELEFLNKNQVNQKSSLDSNRITKDKLLVDTKGQEVKYQQLLSQVEKQQLAFFEDLRKLEQQAVINGTVITRVTASSVPQRGTKIFSYPYSDYYLTQGYGYTSYARKSGVYGAGGAHNGIDIVSGLGSGIHPIATGEILASGFNNGFGNWVAVKHGSGMVSVYAHMRNGTGIKIGAGVDLTSIIGYEGTTGNSTGSHLHLSVYKVFFTYLNPKNGQLYFNYFEGTVNPLDYM